MKKNIASFSLLLITTVAFSQGVEITPNATDNLKIGDYPMNVIAPQKGIIIRNTANFLQSRINLMDESDGGNVNAIVDARASSLPALSAMQVGTISAHPINFFINNAISARINKNGNFGVGVPYVGYANKDYHKAKIEAYGVGDSSVVYSSYAPFNTAVLGQAYSSASGVNRVGVMGITDGQTTASNLNIGLMSIPLYNPSLALPGGYYLGTLNEVRAANVESNLYGVYNLVVNSYATNASPAYGAYNSVSNTGTGIAYGNYSSTTQYGTAATIGSSNSAYTYDGDAYGTYNDVMANGSGKKSYGIYNYIDPGAGPGYGIYNSMRGYGGSRYGTYNDMTVRSDTQDEFGTYNDISGSGTGFKYGVFNTITRTNGYSYGTYNSIYASGTNDVRLRGVFTTIANGSSGTFSSTYGEYIDASASSGVLYGIYSTVSGTAPTKYAGYFLGNVTVTGTLSKGGGSFKIDHPLDPENKYLYHSFVESPDMMNVYNGNITTNATGDATVVLPTYFEALNKDFRYQLTVIGQFAQAIVAEKISNNQFKIKTDKPNVEVSWQVTGIRQDAFANTNRIPTEVEKPKSEVGTYLHPEAYGKPTSKSVTFAMEEENRKTTNAVSVSNGRSEPIKKSEKDNGIPKQLQTPLTTQMDTAIPTSAATSTDIKK